MKNFYAAIFIIILASLSTFAQLTVTGGETDIFAPAREEFSIASSSVKFVDRNQFVDKNGVSTSEAVGRRYLAATGDTYFYIFSDAPEKAEQYRTVSKFIETHRAEAAVTSVHIGKAAGEKFAFADADGFFHKILIVGTGQRTYIFQTVSRTKDDADAERFFAGVRFNGKPLVERTTAPEEPKKGAAQKSVENSHNGSGTNVGFGSGAGGGQGSGIGYGSSGTGSGQGSGGGGANSDDAAQTTPFKLLTKPHPSYTDFARFYQISGTVRVRVMFMATGEIGTVSAVTKLPFGLTVSALKAARSLEFSPATKNGKPYSVVKTIEYNFTIY